MMLDEEERVAAVLGGGIEVAQKRMALTSVEKNPVRQVDHMIAALEALNLHLQHIEAEARQFDKRACLSRADVVYANSSTGPDSRLLLSNAG